MYMEDNEDLLMFGSGYTYYLQKNKVNNIRFFGVRLNIVKKECTRSK